ncbi:MAG: hypothetical protein WKF54_13170 [Nocardioidaceae bacterium]
MRWAELARRQPGLGVLGRQRLLDPGVALIVTIRRDGTPRLSPVEPWVMDKDLWLSMLWASLKARDLRRDPRVLVHGIVTSRDGGDGEFKVRGLAVVEERTEVQSRYAADVGEHLGWRPEPGRFHLFRVDVHHVAFIRYDDETGDQFTALWPPAHEFVRRGTSATSLGDPTPLRDLLVPDTT